MASTSRNASSSMGVTGSTIVHSPTAATELDDDRDHDPFPIDVTNRQSTYEQQQSLSRPPSAQPRRSANVSRMGTSRVDSPVSDANYPSWLPRRPLAPAPASTDNGHGGGRLADLFSFSRGHSRNVTSSTNRMSYDVSGHVSPTSERKPTDGSGGGGSITAYPGANKRGRATPRSVRIAPGSGSYGVHEHRQQETTEQTRRPSSSYSYGHHHHGYTHVRGFSRSTANPYAAGMLSQSPLVLEPPDLLPQPMPAPRFHARNLNLSLLRSPGRFIRFRYLLQPIIYFAHVPAQLFFDFNVVYILVQITRYPTPVAPGVPATTPSPSWLFALIAYLLATVLWLVGVVLVYEIAWCFWRRWRVKRPGMLGVFSSRPARKLVGMGSYDRFCFLEYVQRGAWTDRTELDIEEEQDRESMGGGWEGKEVLAQEQERQKGKETPREEDEEDEPNLWTKIRRLNYRQGLVEWAWNRSQNLPTVALLIPRACIAFTIILVFTKANPLIQAALNNGSTSSFSTSSISFDTPVNSSLYPSNKVAASRDEAFFSGRNGALTGYAKAVLWIDCIWALWRLLVLIGAYIGLWIASGQSCAGVCGPRWRWEEYERQEWEDATNAGLQEKYGSGSKRHLSLSGDSTIGGVDRSVGDIADQLGWQWRENTRRRVREAYEFCLLAPLPHRKRSHTSHGASQGHKGTDDSQSPTAPPLTALEQALLTSRSPGRKQLVPDLFDKPAEGGQRDRDSLQLVPPAAHLSLSTADPNGRGAPITELPYPFPAYKPGQSGAHSVSRRDSIPFPSPHEQEIEELEASHLDLDDDVNAEQDEDQEYPEDGEYVDEGMEYVTERAASASLSSLGQPISPRLQFVGSRARNSLSTGVGGSQRNSGYKSTSSGGKSASGDQHSPRKSSAKSSSHYSPRRSSGSQQSPLTDSSGNHRLTNIMPPPSTSGQSRDRRRTGGSASHLPTIVSPIAMEDITRTRTTSSHAAAPPGVYEVSPGPEYELPGSEEEEEEEIAVEQEDNVHVGSQEDAEQEDSIGLLSKAPSHQSSLAAIRQRASSLSNSIHRLRTRSQGAGSGSNSNSGGSNNASGRSRTRSLAQQNRPESHAMSFMGSGNESGYRSRSRSRSRTSSLVPVIGARYTSTRPNEFGVMRGDLIELGGEGTSGQGQEEQPPIPPLPPFPRQGDSPSGSQQGLARARVASAAPSERTILQLGTSRLAAHPNLSIEHPDISEARESFITAPASVDASSTTRRGNNNESTQSVSTWAHVPGYLHDPSMDQS